MVFSANSPGERTDLYRPCILTDESLLRDATAEIVGPDSTRTWSALDSGWIINFSLDGLKGFGSSFRSLSNLSFSFPFPFLFLCSPFVWRCLFNFPKCSWRKNILYRQREKERERICKIAHWKFQFLRIILCKRYMSESYNGKLADLLFVRCTRLKILSKIIQMLYIITWARNTILCLLNGCFIQRNNQVIDTRSSTFFLITRVWTLCKYTVCVFKYWLSY